MWIIILVTKFIFLLCLSNIFSYMVSCWLIETALSYKKQDLFSILKVFLVSWVVVCMYVWPNFVALYQAVWLQTEERETPPNWLM